MTAGRTSSLLARGGTRLAIGFIALLCTVLTAFTVNFPALTGRIVDQANIIPADTRNAIEPKLADLDAKSGIQLVVATVASLEGQEIEPYANELFRSWKIGEKTKTTACFCLLHRTRGGYASRSGMGSKARSRMLCRKSLLPTPSRHVSRRGISAGASYVVSMTSSLY